jgi:hypothetical protein
MSDEEPEEEFGGDEIPIHPMYGPAADWRRSRALEIVIGACRLVRPDMTDEERGDVRQILFSALRLFFQAQKEIRPGCFWLLGYLPFRTWSHPMEMTGRFEKPEEIHEIAQQLVAAPDEVLNVLEKYDRLYPHR